MRVCSQKYGWEIRKNNIKVNQIYFQVIFSIKLWLKYMNECLLKFHFCSTYVKELCENVLHKHMKLILNKKWSNCIKPWACKSKLDQFVKSLPEVKHLNFFTKTERSISSITKRLNSFKDFINSNLHCKTNDRLGKKKLP